MDETSNYSVIIDSAKEVTWNTKAKGLVQIVPNKPGYGGTTYALTEAGHAYRAAAHPLTAPKG